MEARSENNNRCVTVGCDKEKGFIDRLFCEGCRRAWVDNIKFNKLLLRHDLTEQIRGGLLPLFIERKIIKYG